MGSFTRRAALGAGTAALALGACSPVTPAPAGEADAAFEAIAKTWLDDLTRSKPAYATQLGDHRFDGELPDVSEAGRRARASQVAASSRQLAALDHSSLSRDNQVDAAMLADALAAETFRAERLEDWAWDPLGYASLTGGSLYSLMARDFAPLPERLASAASRMEKIPALLEATRAQLAPERVPPIHASTYSAQNAGAASIIDSFVLAEAGPSAPASARTKLSMMEAAPAFCAE